MEDPLGRHSCKPMNSIRYLTAIDHPELTDSSGELDGQHHVARSAMNSYLEYAALSTSLATQDFSDQIERASSHFMLTRPLPVVSGVYRAQLKCFCLNTFKHSWLVPSMLEKSLLWTRGKRSRRSGCLYLSTWICFLSYLQS